MVRGNCARRGEEAAEWGEEGLTRRFRGNLVVAGAEPFSEESWTGMVYDEVCSVQFVVCSVQCAVYSVHSALYSVQCAAYSVHCAVCNV